MEENEIKMVEEFVDFYEILKKDVHTLFVERSENPLDYTGKSYLYKNIAFIKYKTMGNTLSFAEVNKHRWQHLIEKMIKTDMDFWGKTQEKSAVTFGCDPIGGEAVFTVSYYK